MTIGTDGSLTEEGSDTTGTFTYKKQLEVGDQVAIYSGDVIPTMDMSSGDNSDVSFIEITGADGDKYTYRAPDRKTCSLCRMCCRFLWTKIRGDPDITV